MQTNTQTVDVGGGLLIPKDAVVATFGEYLMMRGVDGVTSDVAAKLDAVISELSVAALKVIGTQFSMSSSVIKGVSEFRSDKGEQVLDFAMQKRLVGAKNYSNYIMLEGVEQMSLIMALSKVAEKKNEAELTMRFKNGAMWVVSGGKEVIMDEAPAYCEKELLSYGLKVRVREEGIKEKFASNVFGKTPVMKKSFLEDPAYSVDTVSLRDIGKLYANGILKGKIGDQIRPGPLDTSLLNWLMSDNMLLKSFYLDQDGVNRAGIDISGSTIFSQQATDVMCVGAAKYLNHKIIAKYGLDGETTDDDAKNALLKFLSHKRKVIQEGDKNVELEDNLLDDESYYLFNLSWFAQEWSIAQTSKTETAFESKYIYLKKCRPLYCGSNGYKYILHYDPDADDLPPRRLFSICKAIDKFVAFYYLMYSFGTTRVTLRDALTNFFRANRFPSLEEEIMKSVQHLFLQWDFVVPLQGVKKGTEDDGWVSVLAKEKQEDYSSIPGIDFNHFDMGSAAYIPLGSKVILGSKISNGNGPRYENQNIPGRDTARLIKVENPLEKIHQGNLDTWPYLLDSCHESIFRMGVDDTKRALTQVALYKIFGPMIATMPSFDGVGVEFDLDGDGRDMFRTLKAKYLDTVRMPSKPETWAGTVQDIFDAWSINRPKDDRETNW